jgi:mono/diheme cytochrome c family protein
MLCPNSRFVLVALLPLWVLVGGGLYASEDASLRSIRDSLGTLESDPKVREQALSRVSEEEGAARSDLENLRLRLEALERSLSQTQEEEDRILRRVEAMRTSADVLSGVIPAAAPAERSIGFNRDIRPILSDNCFKCHGPDANQRKAGLRLDQREAALSELKSGNRAIVPGDRNASALYQRITTSDEVDRMPPHDTGKTLSPEQIEVIGRWIDEGAQYQKHWAFEQPVRETPPVVQNEDWIRNEIDRFVLARLEKEGIEPSPEADRITLLRRVHLDLTGLPPSPEEIGEFLADAGPDAYEKVVDKLLASPHYGERWARHWLDAARYADSNGYSIDGARSIWKYRDWVIDAFNRDLPFDRFAIEQLAGDLLPDGGNESQIATGFHRNTMINQEGGVDKEEFRIESVIDRVNTTGTVFLGLTIGCAQCHDHKYDPIGQREYYELFAFFNNDDEPDLELPTPEQKEQKAALQEKINALQSSLDDYIDESMEGGHLDEFEKGLTEEDLKGEFITFKNILEKPKEERSKEERDKVIDFFKKKDSEAKQRIADIDEIRKQLPNIVSTMVLKQREEPRETHFFLEGDFTRKGDRVYPSVPAVLHSIPKIESPTRLDFARWLVDPENPLTSRVVINRFWQRLFGEGIVETENDFGTQGAPPTHPDLLDWLATEFIERDWSMKAMLRLMVTSATYRQSSHAREELAEIDPNNRLLARQSRFRLDAEVIRDSALVASGKLNGEIGGPGAYPPQPDGVMNLGQSARDWNADEGPDRFRRGMYTYFWRMTPYPSLTVFDAPNAMETCTRRNRSNNALQALTLLNDQAFYELAVGLADRILAEGPADNEGRLDFAYRVCLGRKPSAKETSVLTGLLEEEKERSPDDEKTQWTAVARVLLNLDEFITRE